ncbi:hypothetical protein BN10_820006 [Phycicoccus elongatus Lp2]|uniref:Uncharacterized protein n=1 Tax=Phycicoccus elongatus Lp2 TaxID=1193181 RepID=N0E589_9MICO|nr:hypothetical protein BN10_820006 [Phycicoccus elongatus Lp2]
MLARLDPFDIVIA